MSWLVAAGTPTAWLIARAAGLVAFAFLTASVWLGLALSTKLLPTRRTKLLFGWHQTLMWTALAMLVLHGAAILLDPVLRFGLRSVLVPGLAPWRPIAVSAGVIGGWLVLALALSFQARRRIGQKRWRQLHYTSFVAFALVLGHSINVGTDLQGARGLIVAAVALAPVLWLVFVRILTQRTPAQPRAARATARGDVSVAKPAAERLPVAV
jgi:sulfoxide reductase heme-binding subunit YedZ